jgi:hypothetical protein
VTPEKIVEDLIDILKIVAWPALVIWIAWFLKDEVKRAALRLIEIGPGGAKFAPPAQQTATPTEGVPARPDSSQPGAVKALVMKGSSLAQQFIASWKAYFPPDELEPAVEAVRRDLPARAGTDPNDQIDALVYLVAANNLQLFYERTYNSIYGSQIQLLEQSRVLGNISPANAQQLYTATKTQYPDVYKLFSFEQWTGFSVASGLVALDSNGNYVLTPNGRGFLKYIYDRRLPPRFY